MEKMLDVSYSIGSGELPMIKLLINFRLTEEETAQFERVFNLLKTRPGKPPTRTDVVKALMGFDYYKLLDGSERAFLSGESDFLPGEKLPLKVAGHQEPKKVAGKGKG
jgi:hypothetical protein